MITLLKRSVALLLLSLVLASCATFKPPLIVPPPQIPPPDPELMIPAGPLSVNVDQLLQKWTKMLNDWLAKSRLCNDTSGKCV